MIGTVEVSKWMWKPDHFEPCHKLRWRRDVWGLVRHMILDPVWQPCPCVCRESVHICVSMTEHVKYDMGGVLGCNKALEGRREREMEKDKHGHTYSSIAMRRTHDSPRHIMFPLTASMDDLGILEEEEEDAWRWRRKAVVALIPLLLSPMCSPHRRLRKGGGGGVPTTLPQSQWPRRALLSPPSMLKDETDETIFKLKF